MSKLSVLCVTKLCVLGKVTKCFSWTFDETVDSSKNNLEKSKQGSVNWLNENIKVSFVYSNIMWFKTTLHCSGEIEVIELRERVYSISRMLTGSRKFGRRTYYRLFSD